MSREDEARLADRLRTGDPSAFRELVEAYGSRVYGLAYEITRNHDDAEDVSQVAFMKIHRALRTLKPGYGLNAWIYQVARNTALDHVRKRSPGGREAAASLSALPPSCEPSDPAAGPEKAVESASQRRRVDEALVKCSERERTALVLRHYHGFKVREIAQTMGISLGAAKSYLFRAIQKLQREFDAAAPCPGDGERP